MKLQESPEKNGEDFRAKTPPPHCGGGDSSLLFCFGIHTPRQMKRDAVGAVHERPVMKARRALREAPLRYYRGRISLTKRTPKEEEVTRKKLPAAEKMFFFVGKSGRGERCFFLLLVQKKETKENDTQEGKISDSLSPCRKCRSRACFATARQRRGCGNCRLASSATGSASPQFS